MALRRFFILILYSITAVPLYAQVWNADINSQKDMDALSFYTDRLKDFREKTAMAPYHLFWPASEEKITFTMKSVSPFETPNILAYFMPPENSVYVLADTTTVMSLIRDSMAEPNERELHILFEAVIFVHELSHFKEHNDERSIEKKQFSQKFNNAFDNRELNDSLVVHYLLDRLKGEYDAHTDMLSYLLLHFDSGDFSEANYLAAVDQVANGFHSEFHDPATWTGKFLAALDRRVKNYMDLDQRTPEQEYAIQGYREFVDTANIALRAINEYRDFVAGWDE